MYLSASVHIVFGLVDEPHILYRAGAEGVLVRLYSADTADITGRQASNIPPWGFRDMRAVLACCFQTDLFTAVDVRGALELLLHKRMLSRGAAGAERAASPLEHGADGCRRRLQALGSGHDGSQQPRPLDATCDVGWRWRFGVRRACVSFCIM